MVSRMTSVIAPSTTRLAARPSARAFSSMTDAIEPGPAIIGMAIGKTLMSSASGVPSISSRPLLAPFGALLEHHVQRDHEQHDAARQAEGAQLNAHLLSNGSPSRAKNIRMPQATSAERIAIRRRCAASVPPVSDANIGAQPGGSMITSRVMKAVVNSSITGRVQ